MKAIELTAREFQERNTRPPDVARAIDAILDAAEWGRATELDRLLDANRPDRRARRKFPETDCAAQGSLAVQRRSGDATRPAGLRAAAAGPRRRCRRPRLRRQRLRAAFRRGIRRLRDRRDAGRAGSDVIGEGDDHRLGVLGWAPASQRARDVRSICCVMAPSSTCGRRSRSTEQMTPRVRRARPIACCRRT